MLPVFGALFFPRYVDGLPECHQSLANELSLEKHSAIIMPRGHGKTTWTRIDLIHDIVYGLEPFIVLVGPTLRNAQMSFSFVKHQLESNELLREVYGDLVPVVDTRRRARWSDSHFETVNDVVCIAIGAGKGRGLNIRGRRPTKAVMDDMESKEEVQSEVQRRKLEEWLYETFMPALDAERGKVKMIGTVLHYACLILKFKQKFGGIQRAAIEDGKPIWWTREKLERVQRDIGSFAFAQEYMNDPKSDMYSDIKLAWIRRRGDVELFDHQQKPLGTFYTAVDPAIAKKETSDETAICTVFKYSDPVLGREKYVVLSCEHGRWNMDEGIRWAKKVYDRYPHQKFGVESVAYQEALREAMNRAGIPASPIHPDKDKRRRLLAVQGLIEFGDVEFMPACEDLITQLVQFPSGEHDDLVDSMVYALTLAKEGGTRAFAATLGEDGEED